MAKRKTKQEPTPAPWSLAGKLIVGDGPDGRVEIAAVFTEAEYQACLPWEANVALMLAAPEMLFALKEARCWIDDGSGQTPEQKGAQVDMLTSVLRVIDTAIAKAETLK